jgi:hypothetical protein
MRRFLGFDQGFCATNSVASEIRKHLMLLTIPRHCVCVCVCVCMGRYITQSRNKVWDRIGVKLNRILDL